MSLRPCQHVQSSHSMSFKELTLGHIVNTEQKYRPRSLDDFVFPNAEVEEIALAYGTGKITRPLILSGPYGTGKSLLAELIPRQIEGFDPQVNRVRSCDLNSSKEIYAQLANSKTFTKLFTINNQRRNYNIIEEVNFEARAKDAFRDVIDQYQETDLTIITTNEVNKIDPAIRSRAQILTVPPCEPLKFLPRAIAIINEEGYHIAETALLEALDAAYSVGGDNRQYYKTIDELLRNT